MCGRYSVYDIEIIPQRFNVEINEMIKPVYNAAPSMKLPIITNENPGEVIMSTWGFVPGWAKEEKLRTINTRTESLSKPIYRSDLNHRCLVIANNFFEWKKIGSRKVPYLIKNRKEKLMAFAGIFSEKNTFSIITTNPGREVKPIHDRMPVILEKQDEMLWLKGGDEKLLKPYEGLEVYQVSDLVNVPANNSKKILKPVKTLVNF